MNPQQIEQSIVITDQKYLTVMVPIDSLLAPRKEKQLGSDELPMQVNDYQKFANEIYLKEVRNLTFSVAEDELMMRVYGASKVLLQVMREQQKECLDCFEQIRLASRSIAFVKRQEPNHAPEQYVKQKGCYTCENCDMQVLEFVWY
jgi:hypothetical protein